MVINNKTVEYDVYALYELIKYIFVYKNHHSSLDQTYQHYEKILLYKCILKFNCGVTTTTTAAALASAAVLSVVPSTATATSIVVLSISSNSMQIC